MVNRLVGITILASALLISGMTSTALGDDLTVSSFSSFSEQTNILLAATGNITFTGGPLTLPDLQAGVTGRFFVQAGNDINILTNLSAGQGWSLSFNAGNNLNITGGSISAAGDISILAGSIIPTGGMPVTNWSGTAPSGGTITIVGNSSGTISVATNDPVYIGSGLPPQIFVLNSETNNINITAAAGSTIYLFDLSTNDAPFSYQWFKDSTSLTSETNLIFYLTDVHRADTGSYSVIASNSLGIVTNNVHVRVLVPQLLTASVEPTSHHLGISFKDNDGGEHSVQDIGSYVVQTSTNLVDWTVIEPPISTNSNGSLSFIPPVSSANNCFFRILSQ